MNRLQKKCFIASAGFHLLLALILLIGPAFLSSQSKSDNSPLLDFVPAITIDQLASGGGNPNAKPPPPEPQPQPQPSVQQVQPPAPQLPPEPQKVVRPPKPEPAIAEKPVENKPRKPEISKKLVTRSRPTTKQPNTAKSDSDSQARATAEIRQRIATAARNIRENLSTSTTIEMPEMHGPGGGGPTYANFLQAVKTRYSDAWIVPDGVTDDQATATASVTIARDGAVLSAHITRRSGNALADSSVETVLRHVKFAAPLPENAKEDQRTVTINFNVQAKRGLG